MYHLKKTMIMYQLLRCKMIVVHPFTIQCYFLSKAFFFFFFFCQYHLSIFTCKVLEQISTFLVS